MANTKSSSASENLYMQLNASELSAIIMKGSPNSNDRDAGFCSGSSEGGDDLSIDHSRHEPSSPTDASEDSLEVKVMPISLIRNKRKSSEPSKVICKRDEQVAAAIAATVASANTGPLKKRIRYTSAADSAVVLTPPASATPPPQQLWNPSQVLPHELMPNPAQVFVRHPGVTTLHRVPPEDDDDGVQQEPLALVLKKPSAAKETNTYAAASSPSKSYTQSTAVSPAKAFSTQKLQRVDEDEDERFLQTAAEAFATASSSSLLIPPRPCASVSVASSYDESSASTSQQNASSSSSGARPQQRNYKNMTRERRIEANARERTRVHTISAAYETLRRAVPSYSNAQKLSKLSVLRVACSYILTLSRMAGEDYSEDQSEPSIDECFDAVTATIQTEGKIRKKKDE